MSQFPPPVSKDASSSQDKNRGSESGRFNQIRQAIVEGTQLYQVLCYEDIDPETGSWIAHALDEEGEVECILPRLMGYIPA